jgi:hypothetical protein
VSSWFWRDYFLMNARFTCELVEAGSGCLSLVGLHMVFMITKRRRGTSSRTGSRIVSRVKWEH